MASLNSLLDSVVAEEVKCAICLHKLETPRILSCLHSFCEKCLQKCVQGCGKKGSTSSALECAVCKESTTLPETGVTGLRLDFRAARLVEALNEQEMREKKMASTARQCEACGCEDSISDDPQEKTPFTYCRECSQILCQRCSAAHAGLRFTQSHTVANITDLLNGKVTIQSKDQVMMCPKHLDEKLKLFCLTCLEPICHDCTLLDHSREHGHQLQFLKDFIPTIRDKLSGQHKEVVKKSEELSQFLEAIDQTEAHILDHTKAMNSTIQSAVEEYSLRVGEIQNKMEKVVHDQLANKTKDLQKLRKKMQHIKSLAEKSLSMTQKVLENEHDLVGIASMYKSLQDAMNRTISEKTDEQKLRGIKKSLDQLHYHKMPLEAHFGKIKIECSCKERVIASVASKSGPRDLQFTHDGRLAAIVQDESESGKTARVYIKSGKCETLYTRRQKQQYNSQYNHFETSYDYSEVLRDTYTCKEVKCPGIFTAIKETATSFPNCSLFSWTRWLPTLEYDSIRCFVALSGNRFLLASSGGKLHLLGDTLVDFSHGLPAKRSIAGLASDRDGNIYAMDRVNRRIYILRPDGHHDRTLCMKDIEPAGIAVTYGNPKSIVITHEPATVSILEAEGGKVHHSISSKEWKKATVACDANLVYVLWSSGNKEMTLERFTTQGSKVDVLIEKERHQVDDLLLAVSPTGSSVAAFVSTAGASGKIVTISPKKD